MFIVTRTELLNIRSHACHRWKAIITKILKSYPGQRIEVSYDTFVNMYKIAETFNLVKYGNFIQYLNFCNRVVDYFRDTNTSYADRRFNRLARLKCTPCTCHFSLFKEVDSIMNDSKIKINGMTLRKYGGESRV